ncbi:TPA: restriction endonuclease subunit S [Staphylococcus pseudintermedius]|nr:restriction endonuclease subunit S [Staphylococcus pseudintermedius]
MEFKEYYLGELCEIKSSKRIYAKDYVNKGIPFYRSKEIIEKSKGLDISQNLYIDNKKFEEIEEKHGIPETGDLLLTSVGTLGVPYIVKNEKFYFKDGNLTWFTNFKSLLNQYYLFYWFKSKEGKGEINRVTIGSTQKALTIKNLRYLKITLPDKKNQFKIINLIQKIENKLENNKQVIANLEELSQTIFKHWFVDFEFPDENDNPYKSSGGEMVDSELGMIPKGWEIITINDFANNNVITGKTPSTKIKENYSETGIPFLTIPDMHNDIFALNTERYISELGIEKLIKKVLPKNSLSISCIATPGLVCIIANDTLTNQQINSFTPNKNALYYLYFKLKSMKDYIRDLGSGGSATLNLNKTQFSKIKLVKPINEILYKYDKLVSPNFKMILNIQKEIQQLTQLRDTLLPKLMSGEIEIPDDIEVMEDELSI